MKLLNYLTIILGLLTPLIINAQGWKQIDDFPGDARDDAAFFMIGEKAYCGTGLSDSWTVLSDFYVLDTYIDKWSQISSMPVGQQRQYAAGFASDTKGYIFGGQNGSDYKNDLWEYDPITDIWTQKTSLPAPGRAGVTHFVIDSLAYFVGGKISNDSIINEVWSYNMNTDSWTQLNDFYMTGLWRGSATSINGNGYLIFGLEGENKVNDLISIYVPELDVWQPINSFQEGGRTYSAMIPFFDQLLIIAGMDEDMFYQNDVWKLKTPQSAPEEISSIPSTPRRGGLAFSNQVSIYYTTGLDPFKKLKETWKFTNPTSIEQYENQENNCEVYPNPMVDELNISIESWDSKSNILIYSMDGNLVRSDKVTNSITRINVNNLSAGVYFLKVVGLEHEEVVKLIKN